MLRQKKVLGFTIIELLVVVAILTILVAIVVPVVAAARDAARVAQCANHMRTWGTFIYNYATVNGGALPKLAGTGDPLFACSGSLKGFFTENDLDPRIAYCPSNQKVYSRAGETEWATIAYDQTTISFADALVLVNNTSNTNPPAGPVIAGEIIVDDADTSVPDNYFAKTGPAQSGRNDAVDGSYGGNYYTWLKCVDVGFTAFIIDNVDTTVGDNYYETTGTASTGTNTPGSPWNGTYSWVKCYAGNSPSGAAVWHFKVPDTGGQAGQNTDLKIEGHWPKLTQYCIKDAKFTIYHEGGSTVRTVSQYDIGSTATEEIWYDFGTFTFTYGQSYRVELSNATSMFANPTSSNIYVIADAIRVSSAAAEASTAAWHFKVLVPGGTSAGDSVNMEIQMNWPKSTNYGVPDVQVTVFYEGGSSTVTIDQYGSGATAVGEYNWFSLGTFSFLRDQSYRVEMSNATAYYANPGSSNIYILTDAVKIIDPEADAEPEDDGLPDDGFAVLTDGWSASTWNPTAYPTGVHDYQFAGLTTSDHLEVVWVFTAPGGEHTVYGWWPRETTLDHATGVPFTIHKRSDGAQVGANTVSQKQGGDWMPIATCEFVAGAEYYVKMTTAAAAGTWVLADAIAIPKVDTGEKSIECIGYLYLGYRANLPMEGAPGSPAPDDPPTLVSNIQGVDAPSSTPLLVDWLSDNPALTSHEDFAHILAVDGSVHKVLTDDAQHRWTSSDGVRFYW